MNEIWKEIPGYEGLYQVSNLGNVFSFKTKLNMKTHITGGSKNKYSVRIKIKCVTLTHNYKQKVCSVATLVWNAFGNDRIINKETCLKFIDGDFQNCRIDNLELTTYRDAYNSTPKGIVPFPGVSFRKNKNKPYVASISIKGFLIQIASFYSSQEAAACYEIAKEMIDEFDGDRAEFRKKVKEKIIVM